MTGDPAIAINLYTGLTLVAICFCATIRGAVSGFGSGLIISTAVVPFVGVKAVVPPISVTVLITNASRIWIYLPSLDLRSTIARMGFLWRGLIRS